MRILRILKKKISAEGEDRSSSDQPADITYLGRFSLDIILLVAVILLIAGGLLHALYQSGQRESGLLQAKALAEGVASLLADELALYTSLLNRFAADPDLGKLAAAGDWDALKREQERIARLLPRVQRVNIFPADWDGAGPDPRQTLSFASLEMLQQVERQGRSSPAEVHRVGSEQQHIALAAPITREMDGKVIATLLLALPFNMLERAIETAGDYPSYVVLEQLTEDKAVSLLAYRGRKVPTAAFDGEIPISGTIWRLVYWGEGFDAGWKGLGLLAQVLVPALALIGVLIYLLSRRQSRMLSEWFSRQSLLSQHKRSEQEKREAVAAKAKAAEPAKAQAPSPAAVETPAAPKREVPAESIFRAYDIRGVVGKELTTEAVYSIGQAIGSAAAALGEQTVIVGRDVRESSLELSDALAQGLMASGRDVVDLGQVPTPVLYFATHFLGADSGVMVTGGHNPAEYNGLKIVIGGESLFEDGIEDLRRRIVEADLVEGEGSLQTQDLMPDYIDRVFVDVQLLRPLKLVVDCGNGVASSVAPELFRSLGCGVTTLFCEVDGRFPNHHPDPANPDNMQALVQAVKDKGADLGVAFDVDGDRLGVVDSSGKIIWPDRLLMLLARDVLLRQPGADVIYDVASSRRLAGEILAYGGRPIMWRTGHSLTKAKLKGTGALLAGEMSGHIFFQERWYGFDDALYSCARLLEVISAEAGSSAELFAQLPESLSTPALYLSMAEGESVRLVQRLVVQGQFPESAKLITTDGVRVELEDAWGVVRSSHTIPALMFRFEAETPEAMERIQGLFRQQMSSLAPDLKLPF